jgi:lysozyme family protein
VIRPSGQALVVGLLLGALAAGFAALLSPLGYGALAWALAGIAWAVANVLLFVTTSRLRKVAYIRRAPEA